MCVCVCVCVCVYVCARDANKRDLGIFLVKTAKLLSPVQLGIEKYAGSPPCHGEGAYLTRFRPVRQQGELVGATHYVRAEQTCTDAK